MRISTSTARLLIALATAGSSCTVQAAEPAPLYWPAAMPPAMNITFADEMFDEVPITMAHITGAGMHIKTGSSGEWSRIPKTEDGCSISFQSQVAPDLSLSFAVFERKQFLPNLEAEAWGGYLAGLRKRHAELLSSMSDGGTLSDAHGVFLFGKPNREVTYVFRPGPTDTEVFRREVFTFVNGKLLIVVVKGPPEMVGRLGLSVDRFLSRLELVE